MWNVTNVLHPGLCDVMRAVRVSLISQRNSYLCKCNLDGVETGSKRDCLVGPLPSIMDGS
jgi:hypothetical protein